MLKPSHRLRQCHLTRQTRDAALHGEVEYDMLSNHSQTGNGREELLKLLSSMFIGLRTIVLR